MLLLRRRKYNVAVRCLRRCLSVQMTNQVDHNDVFISNHDDTPSTSSDAPPLMNTVDKADNAFIAYKGDTKYTKHRYTLAIKDNICTLDFPTTCASHALKRYQSPFEATVVSLLKQHGAAVVGKTNMDEFGMGSHSMHSRFGSVVQRHARANGDVVECSAGGSSGGSALAVARRICGAAVGTDTGGSVRLPAAYCGVVGFKPSYGLISRWGVIDYANSFDTVGFFALSSATISHMFEAAACSDVQDPTSLPQPVSRRALRRAERADAGKQQTIGVPVEYNIKELSPLVKQAWIDALQGFRTLGFKVIPISLPSTKAALSAYYVLALAEAASNLAKYDGVRYGTRAEGADGQNSLLFSKTRGEAFGSEVKRRILLGNYTLSADAIDNYFIQAQKVRRKVQVEFNNVFFASHPLLEPSNDVPEGDKQAKVDFILCPTAPTPPPKLKDVERQSPVEAYINDIFTVPASMAGLPAVSVPWCNPDPKDPTRNVGLQIIGQYGHDKRVLGMAKRLQDMQRPAK